MAAKELHYADDYKAGDVFDLGSHEVTRDEMLEFARKHDPFPFHADEEAARSTVFGGIIASGWQTALIWLRLMHQSFICHETTLGSPGHEEMNWPQPVRPGDRLTGRVEIRETRISRSRPGLGFVRFTATLSNQNGAPVFVTTTTMIVKSRPPISGSAG
jgi:acyl dehydratase